MIGNQCACSCLARRAQSCILAMSTEKHEDHCRIYEKINKHFFYTTDVYSDETGTRRDVPTHIPETTG